MKNSKSRKEKCRKCGRVWNVSKHLRLSKGGYKCPYCSPKNKNKKRP